MLYDGRKVFQWSARRVQATAAAAAAFFPPTFRDDDDAAETRRAISRARGCKKLAVYV